MGRLKSYNGIGRSIWPRCHRPRLSDQPLVTAIQQYASSLESSPDHRLREQFAELRERVQAGDDATAESVVVPSFALTYEAIRRALGMTYFDVQLLAGLVLASGAIAEMQTGEGKTIVAALPATLHSLLGQGVHIATVNSYLAERDYEQLRPALSLLGLSVGLIKENASPQQKKAAYDCDITYATGYQLGFDYLYDQIVLQKRRLTSIGTVLSQSLAQCPVCWTTASTT